MKNSRYLISAFVVFTVFIFSFTPASDETSDVKISIKGLNHDWRDGLKPSEFAEMTIESIDVSIAIDELQITLARGNRAVDFSSVKSGSFNLRNYTGNARAGDRIVVEIKKSTDKIDSSSLYNSVIVIKVN